MADKRVKLSEVLNNGIDVRLSETNMSRKKDGGLNGSTDGFHLAMSYGILQELKQLNATLNCFRLRRGMDALHSIDRRLARPFPLKKRKKKAGSKP